MNDNTDDHIELRFVFDFTAPDPITHVDRWFRFTIVAETPDEPADLWANLKAAIPGIEGCYWPDFATAPSLNPDR